MYFEDITKHVYGFTQSNIPKPADNNVFQTVICTTYN